MRKSVLVLLGICSSVWAGDITSQDRDLSGAKPSAKIFFQLTSEGRRQNNAWIYPAQQVSAGRRMGPATPGNPVVISGVFSVSDNQGQLRPAKLALIRLVSLDGYALVDEAGADADGRWILTPPPNLRGAYSVRFRLDNRYWTLFKQNYYHYEWEGPALNFPLSESVDIGSFRPDPNTANGQLGVLYLTLLEAVEFFKKN